MYFGLHDIAILRIRIIGCSLTRIPSGECFEKGLGQNIICRNCANLIRGTKQLEDMTQASLPVGNFSPRGTYNSKAENS